MGNIVILDENTANKIAAGEVIERPASVVKELVENSIDAGATSVNVEVRNGGITYIKITDNGSGIREDDAEIAFERHATSKIRSADDLEHVLTMGFRGEALASIAAVADVQLTTRMRESEAGTFVEVRGGRTMEVRQTGCPAGTTLVVRDLFFNTPARFKFLKKDTTEAGYISETISRIALGNPAVSFRLVTGSTQALYTPGNNDQLSAIFSVYGKETARNVFEVKYADERVKITGYVGKPEIARSNRNHQYVYINRRFIKSKIIMAAVDEAYNTFLMKNKFPFVLLNVEINPMMVDVNVHPTKMEVKFSGEQDIFKAVFHAVNNALLGNSEMRQAVVVEKQRNPFKMDDDGQEREKFSQQSFGFAGSTDSALNPGKSTAVGTAGTAATVGSTGMTGERRLRGDDSISVLGEKSGTVQWSPVTESKKPAVQYDQPNKRVISNFSGNIKEPANPPYGSYHSAGQPTVREITNPESEKSVGNKYSIMETPLFSGAVNEEDIQPYDITKETSDAEIADTLYHDKRSATAEHVSKLIRQEIEAGSINSGVTTNPQNINNVSNPVRITDTSQRADEITASEKRNLFGNIRIVGQLFSTYIILQQNEQMILIDQHAAHERILYEELKKRFDSREAMAQLLLDTVVLELTHQELRLLEEEKELFFRLGFEYEEFGSNSVILRAVPFSSTGSGARDIFLETLDKMLGKSKSERQANTGEALYTIACKAAVKANRKLEESEIKELLAELEKLDNPFTCPHGRPSAVRITKYELEKMFKRIV